MVSVCPGAVPDSLAATADALGIPVRSDMEDIPLWDMAIAAHCQRYIPSKVRGWRSRLPPFAFTPAQRMPWGQMDAGHAGPYSGRDGVLDG